MLIVFCLFRIKQVCVIFDMDEILLSLSALVENIASTLYYLFLSLYVHTYMYACMYV